MAGPKRQSALRAGALLGVLLAAPGQPAAGLISSESLNRASRLLVTPAESTAAPGLPCRLDTDLARAPADPGLSEVGELSGFGLDRSVQLTVPFDAPLRGKRLAARVGFSATKSIGPRADVFHRRSTDCTPDRGDRASSATPRGLVGDPNRSQEERG